MKFSSYLTALGLSLLFSMQSVHAEVSALDLPDFGDSAGSVISPEMERRIGEAFMRHVRKNATIVGDPEVQSYIRSLGYRLVSNSDDSSQDFTFFVVRDPMINAFAAPGGVIGVHSGVFINAQNESELAAVVAHEIAHVTQRHMARMYERQDQLSLPMLGALVASILVGIANPRAGQAAITAVAGAQAQYGINFTRANEEEADSIGMQILARSDFDPEGMPGFFERLQQNSRYYQGNAPEFLRTHPLTTSRIAEARARAEKYPDKKVHDSESFELVRMKLIVMTEQNADDAVKRMEGILKEAQQKDEDLIPARYGYAIALTNADRFQEAQEQMRILLNHDNEKPAFLLAAAKLQEAQQNFQSALQIYEQMQNLYPDYRPLILAWADTLIEAGKPVKARDILRKYGRSHEIDHQYYDLLSRAEGMAGNDIESGIAKAEYFYLIGDTQLAIERLKHTQRQQGIDYYQQQRISARLDHYYQERELERELQI